MIQDMPVSERPISEEFRIISKKWVAAKREARLLEELKTPELEKRKSGLIDSATPEDKMSEAKAERIVKASDDWHDYVVRMVEAEAAANLLEKQLEHIEKRQWEVNNANANKRAEMRL